jgi:hypothetical protein
VCSSVFGARPSQDLLPATTKGYVSVANLEELKAAWNKMQMGQLVNDPVMKPFVDDLRRQFKSRLNQAGVRLGVTWEDLQGVASGEVAIASIQPRNDKTRAATTLLADVTGHQSEATQLLQKISKDLLAKGAQKGTTKVSGVDFVHFALAKKKPTDRQVFVFYAIHQDQLVVADDLEVVKEIVARFAGGAADSLQRLPAFAVSQERSSQGLVGTPHLAWFIEPFGYVEVVRAYAGGRKKRGTDTLKVLAEQGFNCVHGIGGKVVLATPEHEAQYQAFIHAPPVKRANGDKTTTRYNLAARMLDFPNSQELKVQDWVPDRLASYLTFRWKVQDAFWHSESLVNEFAGADVFRDVLNDIEKDPNGPQINAEKEFIRYLGERVTVLSDYREPITTKSERVLLAIEVTNPQAVMATVNKTMQSDPNAKEIKFDGHTIWEMTQEEEFAVEEIKIDGLDIGQVRDEVVQEEETKEFRPNAAVTVAHGHFLVGTHVDYVADILKKLDAGQTLGKTADYQRVSEALVKLGANEDSFRYFTRTDQAYRVTYEMLRQNKMPEAETMLAKLLNGMFAPEDEDSLREQQIDGSKLPEFTLVQKYLGPSGLFIRSSNDGWAINGCLLSKPQ